MTPEFITALAMLVAAGQGGAAEAAQVFFRVGAAMAVLPAFGDQMVPMRVRLALALAFTAVVAPAVAGLVPPLPGTPVAVIGHLLAEVAAGLTLGLALRLMVIALQVAGTMAAQATSLAALLGGAAVDPQPAIAQLLVLAGLALALAAGLHVRIAEALILSYAALPAGRFVAGADLAAWGVAQVARGFGLAFMLAVPFLIAALVYNMALGAINRAMPQLMVAFVGAPALTAGGLILLLLAATAVLALWQAEFGVTLTDPFDMP